MKHLIWLLLLPALWSCSKTTEKAELPILGRKEARAPGDTIYHTIADYSFVNQDSIIVTPETFDNKVYVADFFFTSCPTICPVMKSQMLRVYEAFEDEDQVKFLSHTIDPTYDTVALLKDYAERLGVDNDKWHFVTGDKEDIYEI